MLRIFFLLLSTVFALHHAAAADVESKPRVLVSVAPYKYFVERIGDATLTVQLMVPAGASAHTYEPTPRQMMSACQAVFWFRIGEPFEDRAINAMKSHCPNLKVVDLRTGLQLIHHDGKAHKGCCPGCIDLHFWLSPKEMKKQVETITQTLSAAFPKYEQDYAARYLQVIEELDLLDQSIKSALDPLTNRNILVSHPAYGYFCRDYSLNQYSIEIEGKDPTPQQLTKLLQLAKSLQFRTIFIQSQYNNKAAKLVANTIHADLVSLDPYSEYYFESMQQIAQAFAKKDRQGE